MYRDEALFEVERLNSIIEKAMDYLKVHAEFDTKENFCVDYLDDAECDELLKILKDEKDEPTKDIKIDKLDIKEEDDCGYLKWKIYKNNYNYDMSKPDRIIADKINEIIDYINRGN